MAGVAMGGYLIHTRLERSADALNSHLEPGKDKLGELMDSVHEHQLRFLNTTDRLPATHAGSWWYQGQEVRDRSSELILLLDPYPGLKQPAQRLGLAVDSWLAADPRTGDAPLQRIENVAAATDALINEVRAHVRADAADDRDIFLLYSAASTGALLLSALVISHRVSRRIILPLSSLEQQLRRTATDPPDTPAPNPVPGWPARLSEDAERLHLRLRELHWESRRDQEALEQNGESALGLNRILTAQGTAGPGVSACGEMVAAEGILAGDYFDTIALPDDSTALILGDVSGHGVQAGLLAVQLKGAVVTALRLGLGLEAAAFAAWSMLADEEERFSTLALIRIDPRTGSLQWLNAGHEEPLLRRRDGALERLATTGPLVSSLIPGTTEPWQARTTRFVPGDLVVVTTDGITEARSPTGTQFGEEAAGDCVRGLPHGTPPAEAVRALYLAVEQHGADWQRDDTTIVAATLRAAPTAG
ncbi:PP2C family protein-serine/threonine phosphatase [Kitasatospora sp. NBC_00315]|uniref:PP2C family protein-serine/threonine phosphatase n=1 Tax=Kitasatospora sp. NBC_00315 TaxID=2975963 RepID=UPI003244C773